MNLLGLLLAPLVLLCGACSVTSTTVSDPSAGRSCNVAVNNQGCLVACHDGRSPICQIEARAEPSCMCR